MATSLHGPAHAQAKVAIVNWSLNHAINKIALQLFELFLYYYSTFTSLISSAKFFTSAQFIFKLRARLYEVWILTIQVVVSFLCNTT